MKKWFIASCATTMVVGTLLGSAPQASADWFSSHHPRRAEVNRREKWQQEQITRGLRYGTLTPGEAQQLESQEGALKRQEGAEVRANGGSLTGREYRQLNHEEDSLSHEIHQDTHN